MVGQQRVAILEFVQEKKGLQCSCLENPRDGGAWWAAIYGVTQSRTQLKRLSCSSSSSSLALQLAFVPALFRFSSFLDYLKQEICGIISIYKPKENILNSQEINFEFFK